MIRSNLLFITTLLFSCLWINLACADFNESCIDLPGVASANGDYLMLETAYGHLRGNIDIKSVEGGCDDKTNEIKFCFKSDNQAESKCDPPVIIKVNNSRILGDINTGVTLGGNQLLKDLVLSVVRKDNTICLMIPTSRGAMPLICKSTKLSFDSSDSNEAPDCSTIGQSCYDGRSRSQSLFNFSGMAVYCLQETLNKAFYQKNVCVPEGERETLLINSFSGFQSSLRKSIGAALIIYIVIYGMKIIINGEYADLNYVAGFLTKFILVVYFTIGFNTNKLENSTVVETNMMTKYALPLLVQVVPDLANIVFNAAGSKGLCVFDISKYPQGYSLYKLWDSLDCRIGYYLGMRLMYDDADFLKDLTSTTPQQSSNSKPNDIGAIDDNIEAGAKVMNSVEVFRFFTVMFGFFLSGNIIIFLSGIIFAILFISVVISFLTSYLGCIITLYVMAYISPIFIPMLLFERTRAYFDSWLKITISCLIQPAVLAGFTALLLTMYDSAIFKNCEFLRRDYSISDQKFSTFELRVPEANTEQCTNSAGYKLLHYYQGEGWNSINLILFKVPYLVDSLNLLIDLLYVLIFSGIFYYLSRYMSDFAAAISEGPSMKAISASPERVYDMIKNAANKLQQMKSSMSQIASGGGNSSKGRLRDSSSMKRGEDKAQDKITGGGGATAEDKITK